MTSQLAMFLMLLLLGSAGGLAAQPRPAPAGGGPKRRPQPKPSGGGGGVIPASSSAPPFPQVIPKDLPPFPGPGWVPDAPPPAAVQSRAAALLGPLWSGGQGTFKAEQTAGRWIVYQAALTKRGDGTTTKGVVAFREAFGSSTAPSSSPPQLAAVVSPATGDIVPAVAPTGHPTIRMGSKGAAVAEAQRLLGVQPADGIFGPATKTIAVAFQAAHGLAPDGIIGPKSWAVLLAGGGAKA